MAVLCEDKYEGPFKDIEITPSEWSIPKAIARKMH